VRGAASRSFPAPQPDVLRGGCEVAHGPSVLSAGRECCAVSRDWSNPAMSVQKPSKEMAYRK